MAQVVFEAQLGQLAQIQPWAQAAAQPLCDACDSERKSALRCLGSGWSKSERTAMVATEIVAHLHVGDHQGGQALVPQVAEQLGQVHAQEARHAVRRRPAQAAFAPPLLGQIREVARRVRARALGERLDAAAQASLAPLAEREDLGAHVGGRAEFGSEPAISVSCAITLVQWADSRATVTAPRVATW